MRTKDCSVAIWTSPSVRFWLATCPLATSLIPAMRSAMRSVIEMCSNTDWATSGTSIASISRMSRTSITAPGRHGSVCGSHSAPIWRLTGEAFFMAPRSAAMLRHAVCSSVTVISLWPMRL